MTTATNRQILGLTAEQATEIRAALIWLGAAPAWAYDSAAESLDDWADNTTDATECFSAVQPTDGGFLWQDEDGDEFEHLIG